MYLDLDMKLSYHMYGWIHWKKLGVCCIAAQILYRHLHSFQVLRRYWI